MTRLRAFWDAIRATYWAVPSLMAVGAMGLSALVIRADEAVTPQMLGRMSWVYAGGPEGARAVLSTIAGSMITVAGVAFSITIVALTLASQQFGPRLLRNFLSDLGNQIVLGTFVSTYLYCLLVLRTVRGSDDGPFVPHLAVTLGVLLAILGLGVLIFFIHHVSVSIQASRIIANVAGDLDRAVVRLFPKHIGQPRTGSDDRATLPEAFAGHARSVPAVSNGYVQAVDGHALLTLATAFDLIVQVEAAPGRFVGQGTSLARLLPGTKLDEAQCASIRAAFLIGSARTPTQDVQFFIEQLVDLAVRALSPGINDPGTARMCLDRLGQMLCQVARGDLPSPSRYDEAGRLRVMAQPVTFDLIAATSFDEIRRYSRSSVSVTVHLLDVIGRVACCATRESDRATLSRHADLTRLESLAASFGDADRALVEASHRAAHAALRSRSES